jgi:hypothetical protein
MKASPIKAKIPSYLVPFIHQTKGSGAAHHKPIKKSGGSRPITPNCFGNKPKINSKQSKIYYQPNEQIF